MTARDQIRAIVDEQLKGLRDLSDKGALDQTELDRLQSLAKTAAIADRLEVPRVADPTEGLDDKALEKLANG